MMYTLSLLDKSPVSTGEDAASAFRDTINLAKRAEELGYRRFWVAEHHNSPELAGSAPEALVAWILAKTSRIRVGSGGVMLQHYSPYKVAEVFNVLSSLAPGRVDLGIGKTPGGLPLATSALQQAYDPARKPDFEAAFGELTTFLSGAVPQDHAQAGLQATPAPPVAAERFLLGASPESARLAASRGWNFVFAGHLNGDAEVLRRSLSAFREESGGTAPILALSAFAASDPAHAARQVEGQRIYRVFLSDGRAFNLGRREQAEEFARQSGDTDYRIEERKPNVLHGGPEDIHKALRALSEEHGIEEFIIEPPHVGADQRLASVELLAPHRLSRAA
ncbi:MULTISPECIES: LLM class flavin-dependent oxidoreductase [Agrobacterium tumefaciens complex]|nr:MULTISPECIES: LLM class flavin-dependent oxidoreductase [Agrobacterium tumefaciens complex]MBB4319124.1 luciferase family oxidoreductase group 1 [Agrobacterium radiobacter]NSZ34265.1 LLM class flavin-dependent oxidoreductase [Agrobacterium tumefaciens]NSZ59495.1 LLM class flavin-dependent oxidoreductase [Agrobacterium tumefaciens]QLG25299.1 LLM class flavin-dependent oxidoreductase [Agrobacterium tumefaciens]WQE43217.1 LLM class flavin-dependent oxidoreductase [Agrobacterium tumefaciens]